MVVLKTDVRVKKYKGERIRMNKAFEKILDMLEEERELSYADFSRYVEEVSPCLDDEYDDFFHRGLERASRLVKEVEEEYKGGWIACSERLPEENQQVILQDFYGNITIEKMKTNDGLEGFSDGDWWSSANNYVAWQPLPEPYKDSD